MPESTVPVARNRERALASAVFLSSIQNVTYQTTYAVVLPSLPLPSTTQNLTYAITSVPVGVVATSGTYQMAPALNPSVVVKWSVKPTVQESADWGKLFRKLDSFLQLEKGWDGYSAAPPNAVAIQRARCCLESLSLENYVPAQVAASVIGGVGVNRRQGRKKVYIEFNNNGKVHALFSDGVSPPRVEPIQPDKIGFHVLIRRMRSYLDEQNP
jgi:hypothetical protein